jgi:excisionase family DNA binding protein
MVPIDDSELKRSIAQHTILRLTIRGELQKYAIRKLPPEELRRIALALLDETQVRSELLGVLKLESSRSAFYRFVQVFERTAGEIHRELTDGAAGPAVFKLDEVGRRLRIDRDQVEQLIDSGELAAIKIGDEYRVTIQAIRDFLRVRPDRDPEGRFLRRNPPKKRATPRVKLSTRDRRLYIARARLSIVMKFRERVARSERPICEWMPAFIEEIKATVGRQVFEDLGKHLGISSRSVFRWDSIVENEYDVQRLIDSRGGRQRRRHLGDIVAQPDTAAGSPPRQDGPSTPGTEEGSGPGGLNA